MYAGLTKPTRDDLWAYFRPFVKIGVTIAFCTSVASVLLSHSSLFSFWFADIPMSVRPLLSTVISLVLELIIHVTLYFVFNSYYDNKSLNDNSELDAKEKSIRSSVYKTNLVMWPPILLYSCWFKSIYEL